jgi:hypothetical protein
MKIVSPGLALLVSIGLFAGVQGSLAGESKSIQSHGMINYSEIYNGFACAGSDFIYEGYTSEHFRKIRQWGFNCPLLEIWWTRYIEPREDLVGFYDEQKLQGLRRSVDLALNEGLRVIISGRVCYDPVTMPSWAGWSTHDYVNLNQSSGWSAPGLDRYIKFWEMIAQRFPECMYCLWHFPYHRQGVDSTQVDRFYDVTFPALLRAVRKYSNNTVIFVPIYQGSIENGEDADYYLTANPFNDENIIYGLCHMMPWSVVDYGNWDYDIQRMDAAFLGVKRWRETFGLPMMSVEYTPLRWTRGESIDESRLACLNESVKRMTMYNVGWMYYRLSLQQPDGDNILADIENFEPNISILTILQNRGR